MSFSLLVPAMPFGSSSPLYQKDTTQCEDSQEGHMDYKLAREEVKGID
jgi:hypothetical protein